MKKIKVAFVNPPHADWINPNPYSYFLFQSHYKRHGNYVDNIEWLPMPYKFDEYETVEQLYAEVKEADVVLFSSYIWNYKICDNLCDYIKNKNSQVICVLGGPHIGTNEPELLKTRKNYDFILRPTKPGEIFIQELLDLLIQKNKKPDPIFLTWELRSFKSCDQFIQDYSVYKEHKDFLKELVEYTKQKNLEPFCVLETTRGCPYKCSFCEWGGGIGSKIYKKPIEAVKEDILCLKEAGFNSTFLVDANFGAFFERDLEIFEFAWNTGVILTDISTVKHTNLERRKKLFDRCFEIVGGIEKNIGKIEDYQIELQQRNKILLFHPVPGVSIQSISDIAMKIANRTDLSSNDKLEFSEYVKNKFVNEGFLPPTIELILGMPGSTLEDFYNETDIIWNFQGHISTKRHDYLFLPDSELTSKEYLEKYQIKLVEVYSDIMDDQGLDSQKSLYVGQQTVYKTISSCFSFTFEEFCEMWLMNLCHPFLLEKIYRKFQDQITPSEFLKNSFLIIKNLENFDILWEEIKFILNPDTPMQNIKRLFNDFREDYIVKFLENNELIIISEHFRIIYGIDN